MRCIDWFCVCGHRIAYAMAEVADTRACPICNTQMEQDWLPRLSHAAQWDDATAVLVFVNEKTGEPRYPGRHDAKMPAGYRREYLRSLAAVDRFEHAHGVANHVMHYDQNGRALDDTVFGERFTY